MWEQSLQILSLRFTVFSIIHHPSPYPDLCQNAVCNSAVRTDVVPVLDSVAVVSNLREMFAFRV